MSARRAAVTARAVLHATLAFGALTGCGSNPRVVRVYEGKVVEGAYVPPEAYAEYLRGVLAAESSDLRSAAASFERALGEDDGDPEVWTRLADVRCRASSKDERADEAIARALKIDPGYAPAFAARATCMTARGRQDEAARAAAFAAKYDPSNVEVEALVVRTSPPGTIARDRVTALTAAHGERVAAWEALVHWGRSHRDAELVARGLAGLVRIAPARRADIERNAVELLRQGFVAQARSVAAAIADVPEDRGGDGPRDATLARLAIDEALLAGDRARAERRAVRGHVPVDEVAARALLLGKQDLAQDIARDRAASDPHDAGAAMVLASLAGKGEARPAASTPVPEACALVLASTLARSAGKEQARSWLAGVPRIPRAAADPLLAPVIADLSARGVIPPDDTATAGTPAARPLAVE